MTKRVFIWVAHPHAGSFCEALADAYEAGVKAQGGEVRRMNLSEMAFESDEFEGYTQKRPPLEPDLLAWQQAIIWADHLLFIHPYWWGAMPARAKSVLDRAMTSGFAYKYHARGIGWDKLLKGRTADVIITSDTPPLIDTLLYRKPGRGVMKNQVLGFCGVKVRKVVQFGSIKVASPRKIEGWLARAGKMGAKAAGVPRLALSLPIFGSLTEDRG